MLVTLYVETVCDDYSEERSLVKTHARVSSQPINGVSKISNATLYTALSFNKPHPYYTAEFMLKYFLAKLYIISRIGVITEVSGVLC